MPSGGGEFLKTRLINAGKMKNGGCFLTNGPIKRGEIKNPHG
jgi:hypothetical protein